MSQNCARYCAALVAALVVNAGLPSISPAQSDTAGLGATVHQLVVEALTAGGTRSDQLLVAVDSASAALLSHAHIAAVNGPGPAGLLCPGSTTADVKPVPAPVGYRVQIGLSSGADSTARRIDVSKRCFYRFHGGGRPYQETGAWELRLRDGRWYVARALGFSET